MFYSNPDIISNLSSIQLPILMNFIKIFRKFQKILVENAKLFRI